jgi:uncharacterized protein (TIGR02444 family)
MDTAKTADGSPFWRFSLKFYALPEVAPACLVLQDKAGADVNVLLFLLFLAETGRQVTGNDIARLDRTIHTWREGTVEPLRALRRRLKAGIPPISATRSEDLRHQIKRAELEAERIEQHALEAASETLIPASGVARAAAAEANLAAYGAYLGRVPEGALKIVLDAFTNTPP